MTHVLSADGVFREHETSAPKIRLSCLLDTEDGDLSVAVAHLNGPDCDGECICVLEIGFDLGRNEPRSKFLKEFTLKAGESWNDSFMVCRESEWRENQVRAITIGIESYGVFLRLAPRETKLFSFA